MKKELAQSILDEINNSKGAVIEAEGNKFNQSVRNMDAGDPLTVGDVITIPTGNDYKVLQTKLNPQDPNARLVPFIMVEVNNEDTGTSRNMRFFPNQLAKIVFPVGSDGKRLPKVKTTGTATKEYTSHATIDEAMEALKGKQIKVTKDDVYQTLRFGDNAIVNTHIYNYDLV